MSLIEIQTPKGPIFLTEAEAMMHHNIAIFYPDGTSLCPVYEWVEDGPIGPADLPTPRKEEK